MISFDHCLVFSFQELYESVKKEQFKVPDGEKALAETFFNPEKQGWLTKEGWDFTKCTWYAFMNSSSGKENKCACSILCVLAYEHFLFSLHNHTPWVHMCYYNGDWLNMVIQPFHASEVQTPSKPSFLQHLNDFPIWLPEKLCHINEGFCVSVEVCDTWAIP